MSEIHSDPQQNKQQQEMLLNYLQAVLKPSDARLQALIKRIRSKQSEAS